MDGLYANRVISSIQRALYLGALPLESRRVVRVVEKKLALWLSS